MIYDDDPLYWYLKEVGDGDGLWVIALNPLGGRDTREDRLLHVLCDCGMVELKQTKPPYEWLATLTDRGRAWLDAAEKSRPDEITKALSQVPDSVPM